MARGSRAGRDFGSLAFAVTTLALGSPWPSWSLYRARSNRLGFGRLPSCASVCCIVQPAFALGLGIAPSARLCVLQPRLPVVEARSAGRPIRSVRSSFQRSPLHCIGSQEVRPAFTLPCPLRRQVTNPPLEPPSWFCTTLAVYSFSTLSGYCTRLPVMGFVMFHRRDSDSSSRVPTLRSFALRVQRADPNFRLSPAGLVSPSQVALVGSPQTLPPRPWRTPSASRTLLS